MRVRPKPKKEHAPAVIPKSVIYPEGYSECFEYRWVGNEGESQSSQWELFNKWTGETIVKDDYNDPSFPESINRAFSFWRACEQGTFLAEEEYSEEYSVQYLLPQPYMSRMWGSRTFVGFGEGEECSFFASSCIQACVRGFLARRRLRAICRYWYYKKLCPDSGYFYFENCKGLAISWYKPRLARMEDMQEPPPYKIVVADSDNNNSQVVTFKEQGEREYISHNNLLTGPFYRIADKGRGEKTRSHQAMGVFLEENEWRARALKGLSEIDLERHSMWETIAWMDGLRASSIHLNDYAYMRAAVAGFTGNPKINFNMSDVAKKDIINPNATWGRALTTMHSHPDRTFTQIYGLYSLAKCHLPVASDGILDFAAADGLKHCLEVVDMTPRDRSHDIPITSTERVMALYALCNILSVPGGRTEFLGTASVVPRDGQEKGAAIRAHLAQRFGLFTYFLRNITFDQPATSIIKPVPATEKSQDGCESIAEVSKEAANDGADGLDTWSNANDMKEDQVQRQPSRRGTELAETALKCLSMLAWDESSRELMSAAVVEDVVRAMFICSEESLVIHSACRLLYSLCYRSESGHYNVLQCLTLPQCMKVIEYNHAGDPDTLCQIRRLEIALGPNGWRGCVEDEIKEDMLRRAAQFSQAESKYVHSNHNYGDTYNYAEHAEKDEKDEKGEKGEKDERNNGSYWDDEKEIKDSGDDGDNGDNSYKTASSPRSPTSPSSPHTPSSHPSHRSESRRKIAGTSSLSPSFEEMWKPSTLLEEGHEKFVREDKEFRDNDILPGYEAVKAHRNRQKTNGNGSKTVRHRPKREEAK